MYDPEQVLYFLILPLFLLTPLPGMPFPTPSSLIKSHPVYKAQRFRMQLKTKLPGANSQLLHLQPPSLLPHL